VGPLAQLVAHLHDAQGVTGSSPVRPTSENPWSEGCGQGSFASDAWTDPPAPPATHPVMGRTNTPSVVATGVTKAWSDRLGQSVPPEASDLVTRIDVGRGGITRWSRPSPPHDPVP
jgi:hypothetical protein